MSLRITSLIDPDAHASGQRLAWLAADEDGVPTGHAFLHLFTRPGQAHLALLELNVHPAASDGGTGLRLLDAAVETARDRGRRRIITQVKAGAPAEAFLAARDFDRVLTLVSARLSLADLDGAMLDETLARPHDGYRLTSWEGMVPDELAATFVDSRRAMDDTPTGGLNLAAVRWDLARVRAFVESVHKQGDRLHTLVAVDESDGAIAGYTELAVPGDGKGDARHHGTAVLPAHRGRGLGLWMKAAMIRQAGGRFPHVEGFVTDTADTNPSMTRINRVLGYLPTGVTHEYRLDL